MTKTEKLSLPQWEATDAFQRSDFNEAFAALDEGYSLAIGSASKAWEASAGKADADALAALQTMVDTKAAQADLTALATQHDTEIALRGNCQIVVGSYVGTNVYGKSNAMTLSFDHKPLFLAVGLSSSYSYMMLRDKPTLMLDGSYGNTITWGDRSVSWYSENNASTQLNAKGTYYYVALLSMTD